MAEMWEGTTTDDYRKAMAGEGPMAAEWENKPHRLIYDLCGEVDKLRAEIAKLKHEPLYCD